MQIFPSNLRPATYVDQEYLKNSGRKRLLARTEVERRGEYITRLHRNFGAQHPLVQLVELCLENDPEDRPSASEVLRRLEELQLDDPYQGMTKFDLISMMEQKRSEIGLLARRNATLDEEVATLTGELATARESLRSRDEQLATQSRELATTRESLRSRDEQLATQSKELAALREILRTKSEEHMRKEVNDRVLASCLVYLTIAIVCLFKNDPLLNHATMLG